MTNPILLRAAKAAYEAYLATAPGTLTQPWEDMPDWVQAVAIAQAKAVLESVREPALDMIQAATLLGVVHYEADERPVYVRPNAERTWQAMIDVVLKDG